MQIMAKRSSKWFGKKEIITIPKNINYCELINLDFELNTMSRVNNHICINNEFTACKLNITNFKLAKIIIAFFEQKLYL
jgi:hypothetical protein